MNKAIALLGGLSSLANCHEQVVTTSDFVEASMQSYLMGAPQLAELMKPAYGRALGGMAVRGRRAEL